MSRVQQGVSEYQSYSLSRQSRLLALYNKIKILNQILNVVGNMEYHCLDQEVTQLQLPVLVLATCPCNLSWSCLKQLTKTTDYTQHFNYLVLLLSAQILLLVIHLLSYHTFTPIEKHATWSVQFYSKLHAFVSQTARLPSSYDTR